MSKPISVSVGDISYGSGQSSINIQVDEQLVSRSSSGGRGSNSSSGDGGGDGDDNDSGGGGGNSSDLIGGDSSRISRSISCVRYIGGWW